MSIEITRLDDDEQWNDLLERTPWATPFHRAEALHVFAAHSGATLHKLVGYKGQEPVGAFPVFTLARGPVTAAYSPPPGLSVHNLGPLPMNLDKLKRRKRDRRHRRFLDAALAWVDERTSPRYWNVRTVLEYDDARPFQWRDYDVTPRYTYVIDLETTPDELLGRFSSDLRRKVRREYDVTYEVTEEGPEAIDAIVESTRRRHEEQGESFPVTAAFVRQLADWLPDGTIRPYVCRIDGEFVGGLIDVEDDTFAGAWIADGKTDAPVPVNDLLEWQVCLDAIDRGRRGFDLMGANHERIYSYKAKFAPDLVPYLSVKKRSAGVNVASKLYDRLK